MVTQMLCLVFAQLGQQHIAQMVQFLAELKLPSIEPPQVLVKVLQRWMDVQGDMLTLFRQKLSLIALTNLIALGNAQILQIPVKGELIAVPQTGVRTRRQVLFLQCVARSLSDRLPNNPTSSLNCR